MPIQAVTMLPLETSGRKMRRREFIAGIGAAAMPIAAGAQERVRRIGIFMHTTSDEPEAQARMAAFLQGLQEAGWAVGRNIRIESRWSANDPALLRKYATELVGLNPDVILAGVGPTVDALRQVSRNVPIIFAQSVDPVGSGNVASLARPGGNATGFLQIEYNLSGKWPELLKELAPSVKRMAVLRDGEAAGIGQWAAMQAMSSSLGVELSPIALGNAAEIEPAISTFARDLNGGLIVAVERRFANHSALIISLATRHQLPAVYPYRFFVAPGWPYLVWTRPAWAISTCGRLRRPHS